MTHDRTLPQSHEELRDAQARSLQRVAPPAEVPGYLMERFLGEGAYGEVWVAIDRNTGRRVAIKFYNHRGGLDWSLLSREVEKLVFLAADRYVVQLIDVGWDADPPFYVMEYLERGSLEDYLAARRPTVHEAVELFREVAIGLSHAHNKGVLHCDLKPANVLLDQDNRPRLCDFGQSRLSNEQSPALGTLFYMAPEQADLQANPDARWDVYALGALLYCMLTGQPPHRSDSAATEIEKSGSLDKRLEAYRKLVTGSERPTAHRQTPGIDRDLIDIVDRCLETRPTRRFANVQAVLQALDARAMRRARRPLLVLGALGPALLLLVVSLFALNGFHKAVDESEKILVDGALETSSFAAEFVAETVAEKVNGRWNALEQEAGESTLRDLLLSAAGKPQETPERERLQAHLEQVDARHTALRAASWVLFDGSGNMLARSPYNPTVIDRNFAYRDYFHGQGADLREGEVDVQPITRVHRSNVFNATTTKRPVVAFSAPVWSDPAGLPERKVMAVLMMTVNLGEFAEIRSSSTAHGKQIAVLVDTRSVSRYFDHSGESKHGAILEHPYLAELFDQPNATVPLVYLRPERTAELLQLQSSSSTDDENAKLKGNSLLHGAANYRDVMEDYHPDYADRWLATARPVLVPEREPELRDVGWAVIVQQRYSAAAAPVKQLQQGLVKRGLAAAGVIGLLLTALWGFVMIGLNDASRSRIAAALRRRAGVRSTSRDTSSRSGTASSEPAEQRSPSAASMVTLPHTDSQPPPQQRTP